MPPSRAGRRPHPTSMMSGRRSSTVGLEIFRGASSGTSANARARISVVVSGRGVGDLGRVDKHTTCFVAWMPTSHWAYSYLQSAPSLQVSDPFLSQRRKDLHHRFSSASRTCTSHPAHQMLYRTGPTARVEGWFDHGQRKRACPRHHQEIVSRALCIRTRRRSSVAQYLCYDLLQRGHEEMG